MEPPIGDALGRAMLDYLETGAGWHVVERDDGFVELMDAGVFFRGRYEGGHETVWISSALTTAMAIEAVVSYRLAVEGVDTVR